MARIFRHHVSPVKLSLAIVDAAVVFLASFIAEWLRMTYADLPFTISVLSVAVKAVMTAIILMLLIGIGGYQGASISVVRVFFVRAVIAVSISAGLFATIAYLLPDIPLWRSILLMTCVVALAMMTMVHAGFVKFLDGEQLGRRMLLLGNREELEKVSDQLEQTPGAGLLIVGNVDPQNEAEDANVTLMERIHRENVDLLVIGESIPDHLLPMQQLINCKLSGVEVKNRLSFYEEVRGYVDLDAVKSDWIVFADGFRGGHVFERAAKRFLDVSVSALLVAVASPILILAMLAVKLTSRGPIFYRQERVGLHGRAFNVLKLRSMYADAEAKGGPKFAEDKDPRITPVGRFLRASRIDEIPQVLNVLSGSMSFVGPRPERPFFVDQLITEVPFYQERHCLKPGITGWAQIRYPYGASFEDSRRKLEYDLYYIKNYSLFLDVLIILQTMRVVLFPEGVR